MQHRKSKIKKEDGCHVHVVHLNRVERAWKESIPAKDLEKLSSTYKVLGNDTRLKMVMALEGGEMCVCDLAAFTGLSDSAVSHQLRRLKDLNLVKQRRDGQILYYSLNDDHVAELLRIGLDHVRE
jgi:DNA-binding transcriptional ArsR family regulator